MLVLGVQKGQVVQIGDVACVKFVDREGSTVRLGFATAEVVRFIPAGLIPQKFLHGMRREERKPLPRILEAGPPLSAAAG
jgi:hypothetical protein